MKADCQSSPLPPKLPTNRVSVLVVAELANGAEISNQISDPDGDLNP